MPELLGDDFELYWDSANDFASPTWVKQTSLGDLSRDHAPERVEIPKRVAFKVYKGGRADLTFAFAMNYDATNAAHVAIVAAIESGAMVHLAIADGPIATAGTVYWHGMFHVTGPIDAALDNAATVDVEAKPHADSANLPEKVTVSV